MTAEDSRPKGRRMALAGAGAAIATGAWLATRPRRRLAYPPGDDAIPATKAKEAAAALLAQPRVTRRDRAMAYAAADATSAEPLLHGRRYFPRMLQDIEAAEHSVHLLNYGYKVGEIGTTFRDALAAKVAAGVEVRLAVDSMGSEIDFGSRGLYRELVEAGIQVVANDGLLVARYGQLGERGLRPHATDFLHFDHRKMMVIDGRVGYVGGSGIEDHFNDERFYDVMCRTTGPIVAQLQLLFLATWRNRGGPLGPERLTEWFPTDVTEGSSEFGVAATVLCNVPGTGHHPISDAIEQSLESAEERIDIVNPYISNRAILQRLLAAAQRGVPVRIVAPGKPTPPFPAAAFRHWYEPLISAGVEILHHPEMAHAKVLRIDERVFVGGCNLDDLSLFRNDELDLLFEGGAAVEAAERDVLDPLAAMSSPAEIPAEPRGRALNAVMDRVSRFL